MTKVTLTKADTANPAFDRVVHDQIAVRADLSVNAPDWTISFTAGAEIENPLSLVPGTDYIVVAERGGTLRIATYEGELQVGDVAIGGFHYALGGNAPGTEGGDRTPQINPCSIWDTNFRPACPNPRGMMLVSDSPGAPHLPPFWRDIYFLNVDPAVYGTSRADVQIADGWRNTPKGYDNLNYYTAKEILGRFGKQLMSIEEFWASAYGVKERSATRYKPQKTGLDQDRTSRFGGMQDTGNLYCWCHDGHPDVPASVIMGGSWGVAAYAGSRTSVWNNLPSDSYVHIGARGRSDHLNHDQPAR